MTMMPMPHHHHHQEILRLRRRRQGRIVSCILLLCFVCSAQAQPPSGSSSQDPYGNMRGSFSPAMGIIVVILISAFFFMVFFSIYLRQCSERTDPSMGPGGTAPQGPRSRRSAERGLDQVAVQALPMLVYAEVKEHKIGKGALECAVCLNEFEDDETLRLLPRCDHVFHTVCIDAWLSSHTTCPVCRSNLAASDPNAAEVTASQLVDAGTSAAVTSQEDQRGGEGAVIPQQDHLAIAVEGPETGDRLRRVESKSRLRWRWSGSMPRFPRSHSTGHSMAVVRPSGDRERYTLRLPNHIRRDVMAGKFQRTPSCAVYPAAGEGHSTRKGHRAGGEGTSGGGGWPVGGRSFKMRRWEFGAKSDRWAFFGRTFSMVVSRGDDGVGEGSAPRGDYSSTNGLEGGDGAGTGPAAGAGSVNGKVFPAAQGLLPPRPPSASGRC